MDMRVHGPAGRPCLVSKLGDRVHEGIGIARKSSEVYQIKFARLPASVLDQRRSFTFADRAIMRPPRLGLTAVPVQTCLTRG